MNLGRSRPASAAALAPDLEEPLLPTSQPVLRSHPTHSEDDFPRPPRRRRRVAAAAAAALALAAAAAAAGAHPGAARLAAAAARRAGDYFAAYPTFLVVGDWGRGGEYNQTAVAAAMARAARRLRPDFVVSVGDNFYESGLTSVDDPAFDSSFVDVYTQRELQLPWHAVLGNHDYGEADDPAARPDACSKADRRAGGCYYSPLHQLDAALAARDGRWHAERAFRLAAAGGRVELFFVDTSPLVDHYRGSDWAANRGGLDEQSWEAGVRELGAALARSRAAWKFVVGHHPVRSNHRDPADLADVAARLGPVLAVGGAQAYLCGHDHNLQHIWSPRWGYHQVTSGAGSKIGDGFRSTDDSPFQYDGNGFAAVRVRRAAARVEYYGLDAEEPLFAIDIPVGANAPSAAAK